MNNLLTAIQFATFTELYPAKEVAGRELRGALKKNHRIKRTSPAFYQMMARLEEAGLVHGWYRQRVADGVAIKERCYRLRGKGMKAWQDTRAFYTDTKPSGAATPGIALLGAELAMLSPVKGGQ